ATENGLFRYDGYTFRHHRSDPRNLRSLSDDMLFTVYADRQGRVWSGSRRGMAQYRPERDDFTRHYPNPVLTFAMNENFIQRVAGDRAGNLWVGTAEGLYVAGPDARRFVRFAPECDGKMGLSNPFVRSLLIDRRGVVWVGTERGLNRITPSSGKVTQYLHDPGDPASLGNNLIRSLYEDRRGYLWVGTEGGLNRLDPATGACRRYQRGPAPGSLSSDTVLSALEDREGHLWVGTWNGLNRLAPGQETFSAYFHDPADPESLGGNTITALFTDRTGAFWVGTNKGVALLTTHRTDFKRYFYNTTLTKTIDFSVSALLADDGDAYWLGTPTQLVHFDRTNHQHRYYRLPVSPSRRTIHALAKDKKGTLWVGSSAGLHALRPGRHAFTALPRLADADVSVLHCDRNGILWIGTPGGLYRYDPASGRLTHLRHQPHDPASLSDNLMEALLEDRRGNLWVGTSRGGVNRLNPVTGRFYRYRPCNRVQPGSVAVHVLFEDSRGNVWAGTAGGLSRLDQQRGTFVEYLPSHPSRRGVSGILEDRSGNLWISYQDGMSKFNARTGTVWDYKAGNGLQHEYYNGEALRNARGEFIFAGIDGLTVFHPDSIRDAPPASLPPVVTDFYLFNKRVPPGGKTLPRNVAVTREITLSYEQFIFAFEFSALHFGHADKSQYAYKLESFEKEWNYAGNRRYAAYSNVPPGRTYTFRVKAADDRGGWRSPETAIRVRIIPPFWQTPWFRAALAASLLGGAGLIYRLRERQHQQRQRELEAQVALRTVQISRQKEHIEHQATEIERINQLLRLDNRQLSENVKDLSEARVMQKRVTFEEFRQIYPDEEACLRFIADLKWKDAYGCGKCGNTGYAPGPVPYSRRCSRCSTIERATTGTLFCRVRFPITKGFYMLFLLSQGKPLTVDELSQILDHPRQTC
ncbi:MAG TPA: two-component regulator propeller domain-containing protein, partial [Cytophagales bacterium]